MKKMMTMITAAVLLLSTTAFATDSKDVNEKVRASFSKNFSRAVNVSWEKRDDFYFASFVVNNSRSEAAYNEEGELVATSRKIDLAQLPMALAVALNEKYGSNMLPNTAVEITYENQTSYYITVGTESQLLKLKGTANGQLTVESKTKR